MSEEWREWQEAKRGYRISLLHGGSPHITGQRLEAATRALMEKAAIMGMATILHQRFSSEPPPNSADAERAEAIVCKLTGEPE